jgi:hypothetical protein
MSILKEASPAPFIRQEAIPPDARPGSGALRVGLVALLILGGCTSAPPSPLLPNQRQAFGTLRVEAEPSRPSVDLDVFATNRTAGAFLGAAKGAGIGLGLTTIGWGVSDRTTFGSGGENVGIGLALTVGLLVTGAIDGAVAAVPADVSERIMQDLNSGASRVALREVIEADLRPKFEPQGNSRSPESILQVSVDRLRARCKEDENPLMIANHCVKPLELYLVIDARARVLRAADRRELHSANFGHRGAPRDAKSLLDSTGEAFSKEIGAGLDGLAADIEAWLR